MVGQQSAAANSSRTPAGLSQRRAMPEGSLKKGVFSLALAPPTHTHAPRVPYFSHGFGCGPCGAAGCGGGCGGGGLARVMMRAPCALLNEARMAPGNTARMHSSTARRALLACSPRTGTHTHACARTSLVLRVTIWTWLQVAWLGVRPLLTWRYRQLPGGCLFELVIRLPVTKRLARSSVRSKACPAFLGPNPCLGVATNGRFSSPQMSRVPKCVTTVRPTPQAQALPGFRS
jgi:hypothetical protein